MKIRTNLVGGIFCICFGIILLLLIRIQVELSQFGNEIVGSRYVPNILAFLFVILGFALVFQSVILKKERYEEIHVSYELRVLVYFFFLVLFVLLVKYLGTLISGLCFGGGTLLFLKVKEKRYYLYTALIIGLIYVIFGKLLGVPLPQLGWGGI